MRADCCRSRYFRDQTHSRKISSVGSIPPTYRGYMAFDKDGLSGPPGSTPATKPPGRPWASPQAVSVGCVVAMASGPLNNANSGVAVDRMSCSTCHHERVPLLATRTAGTVLTAACVYALAEKLCQCGGTKPHSHWNDKGKYVDCVCRWPPFHQRKMQGVLRSGAGPCPVSIQVALGLEDEPLETRFVPVRAGCHCPTRLRRVFLQLPRTGY